MRTLNQPTMGLSHLCKALILICVSVHVQALQSGLLIQNECVIVAPPSDIILAQEGNANRVGCELTCLNKPDPVCVSFNFITSNNSCYLYSVGTDDPSGLITTTYFPGADCYEKDECYQNTMCGSNGVCQDEIGQSARCECLPGYIGDMCDETDYCANSANTCDNGGSCVNEPTEFTCDCVQGFSGQFCEIQDFCFDSPCENGGSCQNGATNFTCSCAASFIGATCGDQDLCFDQPCLNGGSCTNDLYTFDCDCPKGFTGDTCQEIDTAGPEPCPQNWTLAPGKVNCVQAFQQELSFDEAEAYCVNEGGHLARAAGLRKARFLKNMMLGDDAWIGLRYDDGLDNFTWTTGGRLRGRWFRSFKKRYFRKRFRKLIRKYKAHVRSFLKPIFKNPGAFQGKCVTINHCNVWGLNRPGWRLDECSQQNSFLCQIPAHRI
ncbi:unnamed protein product [Owenia fusiformis]|uniref:Uncharacterized protein n=1 Tax=Owenia fusiformis TaxID=6347 RepID=A0A8S4N534_OWEFU|nr:unnamed protein product [Owenia fusiformis]